MERKRADSAGIMKQEGRGATTKPLSKDTQDSDSQ